MVVRLSQFASSFPSQTLFVARAQYPQPGQGKTAAGQAERTISVMEDLGKPDRRGGGRFANRSQSSSPSSFPSALFASFITNRSLFSSPAPCAAAFAQRGLFRLLAELNHRDDTTEHLTRKDQPASASKTSICPFFGVRSDSRGNLISAVKSAVIASVTCMKPAIKAVPDKDAFLFSVFFFFFLCSFLVEGCSND